MCDVSGACGVCGEERIVVSGEHTEHVVHVVTSVCSGVGRASGGSVACSGCVLTRTQTTGHVPQICMSTHQTHTHTHTHRYLAKANAACRPGPLRSKVVCMRTIRAERARGMQTQRCGIASHSMRIASRSMRYSVHAMLVCCTGRVKSAHRARHCHLAIHHCRQSRT